MPEANGPPTAVVVSGGKQYRVAAGDRILVDRLAAEPGTELSLGRVLMIADGTTSKVLPADVIGLEVTARVLRHTRGPKIDVLRYKSKKRVRVHRGARADLTAVEVLGFGAAAPAAPAAKPAASRRRAKAAPAPEGEGERPGGA